MSEVIDQLIEYRDDRLRKLKENTGFIETLQDQNRMLEVEIKTFETAIKLCRKEDDSTGSAGTLPLIGKYADMKLSPAVQDVVNTWGDVPGLFVPQIIEKLTQEGFQSNSENLYASVYSIALRLLYQKKIAQGEKDGKRTFMKKI